MQTTIEQRTPVEFVFDLKADAEALAPRIEQALKQQRGRVNLKGFRPGRVPLSLVKKMYGKSISMEVVEVVIQEQFQEQVVQEGGHEIFGPSVMETLEYEPFGDLHAVILFGKKPEFKVADLGEEEVLRLTHEVDEQDIDEEIESLQTRHATAETVDEPAGEDSLVVADFQRLDMETDSPIIGEKQEGITVYLGNPNTIDEIKQGIIGLTAGESRKVTLPHPEGPSDDEDKQPRRYEITVHEVKRRDLPDLDDREFVTHVTGGEASDAEGLRSWVRARMEERWQSALREELETRIRKQVTERHADLPVPGPVVETYLDHFIEDMKRQAGGELPDDFDAAAFRENNRESAEELVRWLLVRDRVAEEAGLSVSGEEMNAEFEEMGKSRSIAGDMMRRVMEQYSPEGVDRLERKLLDKKVYDELLGRMKVVEKTWSEEYEKEDEEGEA